MEPTQIIVSPWDVIATGIFIAVGWRIGSGLMDSFDDAIDWAVEKVVFWWMDRKYGGNR